MNTSANYKIIKSEWWVPCDHELCHQLHRRFGVECEPWRNPMTGMMQRWYHEAHRFAWYIVDANENHLPYDFATRELSDQYETKREAKQALDRMLQRIARDEVLTTHDALVSNYTRLKSRNEFELASAVAEEVWACTDKLVNWYNVDETLLTERRAEVTARVLAEEVK